jgi:chromosome segregation ATPase
MIKRALFVALVPVLLFSCNIKENAHLQSQVDSLKVELESQQKMAKTLQEVGALLDSIDANRDLIRVSIEMGTTYDDYKARMSELNDYVRQTEAKIEQLEKSVKESHIAVSAYSAIIKKMKVDLNSKSEEIALLNERVEKYRNENRNLVSIIDLQVAEISEKEEEIREKEQELALIENKIQQLLVESKMSEADAFYARAVAMEEAANRTKLAPRKKRETLKEALELYKKALSLGRTDAQKKIDQLSKDID